MKILIAGNGKLGEILVRQLSSEGYDLTLIDSSQEVLAESVERYDVMTVYGNCASMETLKRANIENTDLLIAVTGTDEVNLLCCMTAHGLNPNLHTIARIRNPEYVDQAYTMRDAFALSLTVNPEKQAAIEIERLLKYPGFLKRDTFANGRVEIVELRVDEDSKLCNLRLKALGNVIKCKVLVCAVLRDGAFVAPNGDFKLHKGDRIFITAPTDNLATLLKSLGIITHKVKRIIVAGGDRISYYLAEQLENSGIDICLIEQDPARCVQLASILPDVNVVQGDASNQSILEREGLFKCDALVSLTGIDELNMVISLYGRSCNVPQTITKLGRVEDSKILEGLSVGSVISARKLCCNTIVRYVRAMNNQSGAALTIHSIADGQAEAIEFLADESTLNCGIPLKKIKLKPNVLIVCISRGGVTEIPNGESCFNRGDYIVVVSSGETVINKLNDIFESR